MKSTFTIVGTAVLLLAFSQGANSFSLASRGTTGIQHGTSLSMFSGGGAGAAREDNPEEEEAVARAAASMGLPVEEYKLAMAARVRFAESMDKMIVSGGQSDSVFVERDVNNPPKKLDVTITAAGKAKGKETVSKELLAALKNAQVEARKGRQLAQQETLRFVASQSQAAP